MQAWRAVLKAFDSATYQATIEVVGSRGFYLSNVPVSRGIAAAALVAGRLVCVIALDVNNPADALVVGVW